MRKSATYYLVAGFVLVVALGLGIWFLAVPKEGERVACTMEAKQCPDGSYVGRTGPKCEFAPCPEVSNAGWKTITSTTTAGTMVTFQYPEDFGTSYLHPVDWPPRVQVLSGLFTCIEAGLETARAGQTKIERIAGHEYCTTKESEGAAGSIYTQYAYAFSKNDTTVILTFTIRTVQCVNYDESQKHACEVEQNTFDVSTLLDRIAQTVQLVSGSTSGAQGIYGAALLGPTCPVQKDPPDPQCADKKYDGAFVVTSMDGVRIIQNFHSDAQGTFRVDLPPGEYAIQQVAPSNPLSRCGAKDFVKVLAGVYTEVAIHCDTGIR